MRTKYKVIFGLFVTLAVTGIAVFYLHDKNFAVLNSAGQISQQQRKLIYFTVALSLVVVVPVFALTFHIVHKYRASNPKARYTPDWDGNTKLETIWWIIPLILIAILAVVTYVTSHTLDPRKPIESSKPPMKIQVVALDWKWLFIYPDKNIATINYAMIPEDQPVEFNITADAPMNSFWVPQLGGQIYAMAGMTSKLNLVADKPGTYRGMSANLSGEGFSDMTFNVTSVPQNEYEAWTQRTADAEAIDYDSLVKQSRGDKPREYSTSKQPMLYNEIVDKYSHHGSSGHGDEYQMGSH